MTTPLLNGTWPVPRPTDRFFGVVSADGQQSRVAGIACHKGELVVLSLIGYDTSVSALLAGLWYRDGIPFRPGEGVRWDGPRTLKRRSEHNKQISVPLEGVREVHALTVPDSAHMMEGLLHPPDLAAKMAQDAPERKASSSSSNTVDQSRFVLGNWDEEYPHERSFLGTLYGMRVLFLHKDEEHPDWPHLWAKELWVRGCTRKLIQPLAHTLGMKAWVVSDDLLAWSRLIGEGTREGWLPWRASTPSPDEAPLLSQQAPLVTHASRDALHLANRSAARSR